MVFQCSETFATMNSFTNYSVDSKVKINIPLIADNRFEALEICSLIKETVEHYNAKKQCCNVKRRNED